MPQNAVLVDRLHVLRVSQADRRAFGLQVEVVMDRINKQRVGNWAVRNRQTCRIDIPLERPSGVPEDVRVDREAGG